MEITAQYMEFLKANYPDIAGKIETLRDTTPTGNTPEEIEKAKAKIDEEINSLANNSERLNEYQIWEKVPTILRDRYGGRVPPEIMEAAARDEIYVLREMEYHPEKRNVEEVRAEVEEKYRGIIMPEDIIQGSFIARSVFAGAIVAGYSEESSAEFARYRMESDELSAKLQNPNLSDEERTQIHQRFLELHQGVYDTIKRDWGGEVPTRKPHQPEKMLVHILGKYNAGLHKFENGIISEEELKNIKDKMVAIMANLQPHLKDRQNELLSYLQRDHVQAKIGYFKDHTRDLLAHYVLKEIPNLEQHEIFKQLRRKNISKDMSEEQQALALAKNMSAAKDNIMPLRNGLSAQEIRAIMPSALNRGNERQA